MSVAVAEALDWPRTAFGDYLRAEIARSGGDSTSRQTLQDLGQARVEADAVGFCRDVLVHGGFSPGMNFIVDGVRHLDIYAVLTRLAEPTKPCLIFLAADDASRALRVRQRGDQADLARADQHRVEVELRDSLPQAADTIIDASKSLAEVVAECLESAMTWAG